MLDRLIIAVVPGGEESVTVRSADTSHSLGSLTHTNDAPGVISTTITDSVVTITGLSCGVANLTITDESNRSCTFPVEVYDPHVLDLGDLSITYTDSFDYGYEGNCVSPWSWLPVPPEGFHSLGLHAYEVTSGMGWDEYPNGNTAALVVKPKSGSDAVVYTDSFVQQQSNSAWYTPIPPEGYVCCSDMLQCRDSIACIREDLTINASCEIFFYDPEVTIWRVGQPDAGPHADAYLGSGTVIFVEGTSQPIGHSAAHCLRAELPTLATGAVQDFVPELSSYARPPDETAPKMARAMLVPCTIINDLEYADDIDWQVDNSPFYRLERQVYYKRLYHNHNQTSEVQTNSVTIRSGITTSQSETVYNETQISISAEAGITFKGVSGKIIATVSEKFGYETQTSISELNEREVSTSINTSPGKAAALWQEYNRFVLYRHSGTELQQVATWEFGIDSYVTDQYPD